MQKKTIFAISFCLSSLVVLVSFQLGNPVPGGNKFHLPEPRDIDINGINFTVSWGFLEDANSSDIMTDDAVLNHDAIKEERTFHQNDILLLNIKEYDFKEYEFTSEDLKDLNDGAYENKSINGVEGILKNESVETHAGFVKNNHLRYYFNYVKDNKLIMIQCDKMNTIEEIVN